MTLLALASVFLFFIFTDLTCAIQVSPDSPCAPVCIDNPNSNVTDPDASTTFGSDITCIDEHYGNTPKGQKFVSCLNCLQTSTASSSGESDQEWFLCTLKQDHPFKKLLTLSDNLRYTLDSCLFGFDNASDAKSSVCTTSKSCGPLQTALENGNLVPTNESEYSYCTANGNAFRGSYLRSCESCFKESDDQQYLRNCKPSRNDNSNIFHSLEFSDQVLYSPHCTRRWLRPANTAWNGPWHPRQCFLYYFSQQNISWLP